MIEQLDDVSTSWLTRVLVKDGALQEGSVESFAVHDVQVRELSTSAKLLPTYASNSTGELPDNLFLKIVKTAYDEDGPLLGTEVDYYARDYVDVIDAPVPRCYSAERTADGAKYHLLLEDLSRSHVMVHKKAMSLSHGEAFADALAILHAKWWGEEKLLGGSHKIHDADVIRGFVEIARPGAEHIIECCQNELEPHWPNLIREIYELHPGLLVERARELDGFTLIHGDLSPGNILVPADADRPIYFIDRAPFEWSLTTWLAVYDLSYAIVTFWNPEERRALERPILKRYCESLLSQGIEDYAWEQLWEDYRLSVPISVYVATEWCRGGPNLETKQYWMPMLVSSLIACDDLQCADLWRDV